MRPLDVLVAAIRALPESAILLFANGQVVAVNAPARATLALDEEQPRDVNLLELAASPRESLSSYLRICGRNFSPMPGAFTLHRLPSHPVDYLCKGSIVLPGSEGAPRLLMLRFWKKEDGNVFVLLNQKVAELSNEVLRRRSTEEALRKSEKLLRERAFEAENLNRLKDEFVATLSHELRTPLSAIIGWVTLLRQGRLPEERRQRAIETIERNARAQAQLVEELLDISRIVAGKMRLDVQPIDPIRPLEASVEGLRPAAAAKGIRLAAVLDPHAGPIMGDFDRLQQICSNLLTNAVKFTPKGGQIQVTLERVNSSIAITVADTGEGIAPEFLPHVFERFRQRDSTTTRHTGGLGLGLAIVKSLVELHGGTVTAHSEGEGKGATFVVRLPRALARVEPESRPESMVLVPSQGSLAHPKEIEGLRVVIVEDEPDALDLLAEILRQCGARVTPVRSANEALAAIESTGPDLLISDIGMPGQDGYSLIRKVRSLPSRKANVPAIALTALARSEDRTNALVAGFHAHVPKPVDAAELLAVIVSLVRRFGPAPG